MDDMFLFSRGLRNMSMHGEVEARNELRTKRSGGTRKITRTGVAKSRAASPNYSDETISSLCLKQFIVNYLHSRNLLQQNVYEQNSTQLSKSMFLITVENLSDPSNTQAVCFCSLVTLSELFVSSPLGYSI